MVQQVHQDESQLEFQVALLEVELEGEEQLQHLVNTSRFLELNLPFLMLMRLREDDLHLVQDSIEASCECLFPLQVHLLDLHLDLLVDGKLIQQGPYL